MVFSSLTFLCVFLPAVFLLALVVRSTRVQNVLLVIASLVFYAYGEPVFVVLMLVTSVLTYAFGLIIGSSEKPAARKAVCACAVIAALGCLGVFKYATWLLDTLQAATGLDVGIGAIALPVGISFYTFQAISYVVDVYRGDVKPQRNLMRVMLYIAFFPQLIAGPIIRYHDIDKQLSQRTITLKGVRVGLKRFIVGLAKKVLIADVLAVAVDAIYGADPSLVGGPAAWVAALAYLFQIYFDFSGYSDMAIGMARMFGFTYKENFDYPYASTSIKEFWRRWHISLSTWLKEYLYIPLGGNRRGRGRAVFNKILVFFCCGLWHGAAWTFVIWGLIQGFFLLLEEYVPALQRMPRPLGHIYALLVSTFSFVIFRADTLDQGLFMMSQMLFGWGAQTAASQALLMAQLTPLFVFTFVIAAVAAMPVLPKLRARLEASSTTVQKVADGMGAAACVVLLVICILTLAGGAYSPFIYFRF